MRRGIILMGVLLAIFATPAAAESGNGLYKPYPAGIAPTGAAQSYYARLGRPLTAAQLATGVLGRGLAGVSSSGPSERAGAAAGGPGIWELAAAIGAAVIGVAVAARRRAPPRASAIG